MITLLCLGLGVSIGGIVTLVRHVRRLDVAVAKLQRQFELALPPPPPGDGPYRSRPPATGVPGGGVVRSDRTLAGVHEDGEPGSYAYSRRGIAGPGWYRG